MAAACLAALPARAFDLVEDFDDGVLDAALSSHVGPGWDVDLSSGRALFAKEAGVGDGAAALRTKFYAVGDFWTTVKVDRSGSGSSEFGLGLLFPGTDPGLWADVFFAQHSTPAIWSNMASNGHVYATGGVATAVSHATLRMGRSGSTLYADADYGAGFRRLLTLDNAVFSGPAQIQLFFMQEFGSIAADRGAMDDWVIHASDVSIPAVPELPTSISLFAGLLLLAVRQSR